MTTSNTGTGADDPAVREELARLRDSIDNIDAAVVHMLAERFKCTQQVGLLKAHHQLPPADPTREAKQIARLRTLAESAKLDPAFAEKFLNFIIAEVIHHHERIADDNGNGNSDLNSNAHTDGNTRTGPNGTRPATG
ncbi:chorismate mutase [Streptomyces sp. NPDC057245]|uniref:chorismate mutase n=1 Tax=Streptomyces TaxID=1883 RepID=UPI001C1E31A1|nr:chorismate mutase [Streptomyces sp. A108]MBU6536112.1 chorismate mutase [Streptomyces sp. A108]